jgi:hypothetical protein
LKIPLIRRKVTWITYNRCSGGSERSVSMCRRGIYIHIIYATTRPHHSRYIDTTPSPHGRINAPSLHLAFAHIHGDAGTPTLRICSAVVGRNGPFLCAEGVDFHIIYAKRPHHSRYIDTTPSPHGRINAPSLHLAFAHIHGKAGTPTLGICSAVVGRNSPFLYVQKGLISI